MTLKRAYYQDKLSHFLNKPSDHILGELSNRNQFKLDVLQKKAWISQINLLKKQLTEFQFGEILFEFSIPRIGKRVDTILLINNIIFVVEFKTGLQEHTQQSIDQTIDYALDLKNFHEGSHNKKIVPILISTNSKHKSNYISWSGDKVSNIQLSNGEDISIILNSFICIEKNIPLSRIQKNGFSEGEQEEFQHTNWADTGYKPTPTIIEAAQALYEGHNVEEISRSDSGAKNLSHTSDHLTQIIHHSRLERKKSICFVTGVPGAGKTLVGLNIAAKSATGNSQEHAVFLSGNGPLVSVLREALARDEVARNKGSETPISKKVALRKVSSFIQNIHHFRDEGLSLDRAPFEHVVIFDEAQRAWNRDQAVKFMTQKKDMPDFNQSEPEFLISLMDRHQDWCVIICLVGEGQEINTGEAGLEEWISAIENCFPNWNVYYPKQLSFKFSKHITSINNHSNDAQKFELEELHLAVSIRSFRAEKLSQFISSIIDGDSELASSLSKEIPNFRLALTRQVSTARIWLHNQARGTERLGLVASSGAIRLKPEGIHVKTKIDPANWFLNGKDDIRSSYYLEDVATEFDIQGLELDWTGMCWDADYRFINGRWSHHAFKGTKWQNINDSTRQSYLANTYRVLLTRARQGMVIIVPKGSTLDHTRDPSFYQETYDFLIDCGIPTID